MAKTTKSTKTTKKPVKKVTKKITAPASYPTPAVLTPRPQKPMITSKMLTLALVVLAIGLLTYKLGPWLVPAKVGWTPVSRFEVWSRLEKSYGEQALDDLVNEKILDSAIKQANIKVDPTKLEDQLATLETQFESTGGLDEALKQRGLSRKDLEKQISTQLAVEEILADQIEPTDEEVQALYEGGSATLYEGQSLDQVRDQIVEELKQTKLRDAFLTWFADVKKEAMVTNFGL